MGLLNQSLLQFPDSVGCRLMSPAGTRSRPVFVETKKGAKGTGLNDHCHRSLQTRKLWFVQPLPIRTRKSNALSGYWIVSKKKLAA